MSARDVSLLGHRHESAGVVASSSIRSDSSNVLPSLLAGLASCPPCVAKAPPIVSGLAFWRSGTDEETTVKARNMRRDARVSLCVDDDEPPFSFVLVEGTALMAAEDPDHLY